MQKGDMLILFDGAPVRGGDPPHPGPALAGPGRHREGAAGPEAPGASRTRRSWPRPARRWSAAGSSWPTSPKARAACARRRPRPPSATRSATSRRRSAPTTTSSPCSRKGSSPSRSWTARPRPSPARARTWSWPSAATTRSCGSAAPSRCRRPRPTRPSTRESARQLEAAAAYRLEQKRSAIAAAESRIAEANAKLALAQQQLARTEVRADVPGIVVYKDVFFGSEQRKPQVGDQVWANQPLLILPDISKMVVETQACARRTSTRWRRTRT